MVDYRNCTDNMFNRAMAMKNKDVDKIPTNYLYIFTALDVGRIFEGAEHDARDVSARDVGDAEIRNTGMSYIEEKQNRS